MERVEFGFQGTKNVPFNDPLFLYLEFEKMAEQRHQYELKEIIDEIDLDAVNGDYPELNKTLPFLSFKQAEILFKKLRDHYGSFTFKGISLISRVGANNAMANKVKFSNSEIITIIPFEIDHQYREIFTPLVSAVRREVRYAHYTHEQLLQYFTTGTYNLKECYGASLGLSRAEYPIYPAPGTVPGELDRAGNGSAKQSQGKTAASTSSANIFANDSEKPKSWQTSLALGMSAVGLLLGGAALVLSLTKAPSQTNQEEQIQYLYKTVQGISRIQDVEPRVNVIARYFMARYFTGDKEAIKPFLSDGDVKFTQGEVASITSTVMETIEYDEDNDWYTLTYVISLKNEDDTTSIKRITFSVAEDVDSEYGWLVKTEPTMTPYVIN